MCIWTGKMKNEQKIQCTNVHIQTSSFCQTCTSGSLPCLRLGERLFQSRANIMGHSNAWQQPIEWEHKHIWTKLIPLSTNTHTHTHPTHMTVTDIGGLLHCASALTGWLDIVLLYCNAVEFDSGSVIFLFDHVCMVLWLSCSLFIDTEFVSLDVAIM